MPLRLLLVLALLCRVAGAEDKPWATGVSAEQQKRALALYKEGNGFFELDQYREALVRYEAALAVWDHPGIRYNAAVSSVHLDKIEEAYEHLAQAMRYGAAPFSTDIFKEAVNYEKLLSGQLGEVEVTAKQPDVIVTLDGKPLLVGPRTVTRRVRAGSHQIVATRSTYLTETLSVDVRQRAKVEVVIELKKPAVAIAAAGPMKRRWARWKPWALVVGGAVVGGIGLGLYGVASERYADYDQAVEDHWNDTMTTPGSPLPDSIRAMEDRARTMRAATISAFAVGGVMIATGITLAFMNTPRPSGVVLSPQAAPDRVGLVLSGRF